MADPRLTPAYDNKIYQKYSKKTIQNKEKNKIAFLQDIDLPYDRKVPLICITYPLTDKNNAGQIADVMNGILEQAAELVVCGIGTEKFQKYFTDLAQKNSKKLAIIPGDEENRRKTYAAADIILVACDSQECLEEARSAMAYGAVPVMPPQIFAKDYDPVHEKGNAFLYSKGSPWSFFTALVRATENFRFPYDWKNIQMAAMENEGD